MKYRLLADTPNGSRLLDRSFNATDARAIPTAERMASLELPYNYRGTQGEAKCCLLRDGSPIHRFTIG